MFKNHSMDMFGLPPIRDYVSYNEAFVSDLPDWATEEYYDDCSTGASWLYKFLKK